MHWMRRRGCPVALLSIDCFNAGSLPHEDNVIFVVSTTGQGDTPDSMKAFWKFLLQRNLNQWWLEGVHYAVFGLGDSGYQKYNFVAEKLDKRLLDLGAVAIVERGQWLLLKEVWAMISTLQGSSWRDGELPSQC
ncbi:hypothetical protein VitviT2T_029586 [Vitis vinifera]|uniref:Flavodoxin-like domain-containing protein n=1 Tax=Vitis vinifera TaxID=29760 RepID=A0ABY9DWQ8_VITVI|nr:hypothetical protein VitviT2T_029586 [Vitis vinifera]